MDNILKIFAALSDPLRLRLLCLLARQDELCVCELVAALGEIQPKVSRHLAIMKAAELVLPRPVGHWMHYRLADVESTWVQAARDAAIAATMQTDQHAVDWARLRVFCDDVKVIPNG